MRVTSLPPVRSRAPLRRSQEHLAGMLLQRLFPTSCVELFGSGTQSLGVALSRAAAFHERAQAQVIIPAYGCPDLVSACVQAGVRPRLIDVASQGWGYDLQQLRTVEMERTAAVVAVNLLGLGDDSACIDEICRKSGVHIVHDSAQYVPTKPRRWQGAVVLSFGRGKPVNLLYGGALISPDSTAAADAADDAAAVLRSTLESRAAALAFNLATHPLLFGWTSRVPAFRVGETRYKPPVHVERLQPRLMRRLGPALQDYLEVGERRNPWLAAASSWRSAGVVALQPPAMSEPQPQLLRYPMLASDREHRDRLVESLNARGLGASAMYRVSLNAIPGLPSVAASQGPFPNAERLAARLLTLPVHEFVTQRHVAAVDECIHALR